jgi:SAM-dependent methyltransferase
VTRRTLNLGSGRTYRADAVNVDVTADTSPDVVHNLNQRPWPFTDDQFDAVSATDVIEHLDDVAATMVELHRVCTDGARIEIVVPHFSSDGAYTDPTHRHYFGAFTFDYFSEAHSNNFYSRARFEVKSRLIVFRPTLVNKLVARAANRFPHMYEQRWTWIFPAWFLAINLTVVKPRNNPSSTAPGGSP